MPDASLTELVPSWIFALAPAAVIARRRGRAERDRVDQAIHELRRPLQALVLANGSLSAPSPAAQPGLLEQSIAALDELERALVGKDRVVQTRLVSCRELVAGAVRRWRHAAERAGAPITVYWDAGPALLLGDSARLAQAIDNVIVNALEHGGPPFTLTASLVAGKVRVSLSDGGRNGAAPIPISSGGRGHGLKLVAEAAMAHGGRFALRRSSHGSVAALELPLAEPDATAAA